MSDSTKARRPLPPSSALDMQSYLEDRFEKFLGSFNLGHVALFPRSRAKGAKSGDADLLAYRTVAKKATGTPAAGSNEEKRDQAYEDDVKAGSKLATVLIDQQHALRYLCNEKGCPGGALRYSALKYAILDAIPVVPRKKQQHKRSYLLQTFGAEDKLIRVDEQLPVSEQIFDYRGKVLVAMQEHDDIIDNAVPANSLDKFKVEDVQMLTQFKAMLPKRFETKWVEDNIDPLFAAGTDGSFESAMDLCLTRGLGEEDDDKPGDAAVFKITTRYGGGGPRSDDSERNSAKERNSANGNGCHFFSNPDRGCNRKKCRFDHIGTGYVNNNGTVKKVKMNEKGHKPKRVRDSSSGSSKAGGKTAFKPRHDTLYRMKTGKGGKVMVMEAGPADDWL